MADQLRKLQDELRVLDMNIQAAQRRRELVAAEIKRLLEAKESER